MPSADAAASNSLHLENNDKWAVRAEFRHDFAFYATNPTLTFSVLEFRIQLFWKVHPFLWQMSESKKKITKKETDTYCITMGKRSIFRNILKVLIVRRMSEMCPVAQLVSVRFLYQLQVLSNFREIHSHAENSEDTLLANFACQRIRSA